MASGSKPKRARTGVPKLTDIPNVGRSVAADLVRIGIREPGQLAGRDPVGLYNTLCRHDGVRHDPCLLDTFMAAVDYMNGAPERPWWAYTAKRKRMAAGGSRGAAPKRSRPPTAQRK